MGILEKDMLRVTTGKQIQKLIRRRLAFRKTLKMEKILSDFKGLDRLVNISESKGKSRIKEDIDNNGCVHEDPHEISEAFACFYEDLFRSNSPDKSSTRSSRTSTRSIHPFSLLELSAALKAMKAGKAHDTTGLAAEMLKVECALLRIMILDLFNDVLMTGRPPPEWQATRLIVLFQKGDPKMPANYRPIAILPILYKLFSRMLCLRIQPGLLGKQSVDQAAYRPGYSTEDHLLSTTLLVERCSEWNVELWMGLVD
jgi:hypothetical protein